MVQSFLLFFLLLLPARGEAALSSQHTEAGVRQVYLLSRPLEQKVKGNCGIIGALWAMNLSWTATVVTGTYLCFHDPISAGLLAAWNVSQDYVYTAAELNTANELTARWRQRKDMRRIAASTRAQEIRVITTGSSRQLGLFNSTLDSKSFIFVETTSTTPPAPFEGREWLPVGDVEHTKVRLQFALPGYRELPALELSLRDIFAGAKIPTDVEMAWKTGMKEWNRGLPLWERYVTKKTFHNEAKITASLVKGEKAWPLGDYATGSGVKKVLGMTRLRLLRRFLDEVVLGRDPRETGPHIRSQSVDVHGEANCSKWYRRLFGKEILLQP